jgi:hypothetical protein
MNAARIPKNNRKLFWRESKIGGNKNEFDYKAHSDDKSEGVILEEINEVNYETTNEHGNLKEGDFDNGVKMTRSGRAVCQPEQFHEEFEGLFVEQNDISDEFQDETQEFNLVGILVSYMP